MVMPAKCQKATGQMEAKSLICDTLRRLRQGSSTLATNFAQTCKAARELVRAGFQLSFHRVAATYLDAMLGDEPRVWAAVVLRIDCQNNAKQVEQDHGCRCAQGSNR